MTQRILFAREKKRIGRLLEPKPLRSDLAFRNTRFAFWPCWERERERDIYIYHIFWHAFWQIIWHIICWHSIRHLFWSIYLTQWPTCILTFRLTLLSTCIVTLVSHLISNNYISYVLTFYLTYILIFLISYLAYFLTFCLNISEIYLTFYLFGILVDMYSDLLSGIWSGFSLALYWALYLALDLTLQLAFYLTLHLAIWHSIWYSILHFIWHGVRVRRVRSPLCSGPAGGKSWLAIEWLCIDEAGDDVLTRKLVCTCVSMRPFGRNVLLNSVGTLTWQLGKKIKHLWWNIWPGRTPGLASYHLGQEVAWFWCKIKTSFPTNLWYIYIHY